MRRITAYHFISTLVIIGMGLKLASFQLCYLKAGEVAYDLHALSTFILACCSTLIIPINRGRILTTPILKISFNVYVAAEMFNLIKEMNGLNEIAPAWHYIAFWAIILLTTIATAYVIKHRNEP